MRLGMRVVKVYSVFGDLFENLDHRSDWVVQYTESKILTDVCTPRTNPESAARTQTDDHEGNRLQLWFDVRQVKPRRRETLYGEIR